MHLERGPVACRWSWPCAPPSGRMSSSQWVAHHPRVVSLLEWMYCAAVALLLAVAAAPGRPHGGSCAGGACGRHGRRRASPSGRRRASRRPCPGTASVSPGPGPGGAGSCCALTGSLDAADVDAARVDSMGGDVGRRRPRAGCGSRSSSSREAGPRTWIMRSMVEVLTRRMAAVSRMVRRIGVWVMTIPVPRLSRQRPTTKRGCRCHDSSLPREDNGARRSCTIPAPLGRTSVSEVERPVRGQERQSRRSADADLRLLDLRACRDSNPKPSDP